MEDYAPSKIFTEQLPVTYGTFWQRFLAALIDGILLSIVSKIINAVLGDSISFSTHNISGWYVHYYSTPGGIITLVFSWLYYALQESGAAQATLGKRALGLMVTTTVGQRISFGAATGRHFGKKISLILLCFGYFMMLWDDKNQTLHDKMAGTLVVKS